MSEVTSKMRYSPPGGRRFSLPTFDIFGQPIFEPYLYYSHFHPFPPPPPPPPHLHHHHHPLPPPHHLHQFPPEHYPYFNVPETLHEEIFIPSSPDTNPYSHSPPHQYPISREHNPEIYSSASSSSSPPNSFSFAESIPSFDVSRTETPGDHYYSILGEGEMVVRTVPHPETLQQQQEKYDGGFSGQRGKLPVPKAGSKNQQNAGNGRAVIVNGSGSPVPTKVKAATNTNGVNTVKGLPQENKPATGMPSVPAPSKPKAQAQPVAVTQESKPQAVQTPTTPAQISTEKAPVTSVDEPESGYVHIALIHLPHINPLNSIRLRANHTANANKAKLIEEAKSVVLKALKSHKMTENVQPGSWFSWTERGFNINFKTNSQRWLATEHTEWLTEIGDNVRIGEKWGGIVIRDIWNTYILEQTIPSDNLNRALEKMNPMYLIDKDGKKYQEEYRIRRVRWLSESTLGIWFHDVTVADYFLQKGVWLLEGYLGHPKHNKVGICGLSSLYPFIETPRRLGIPIKRGPFPSPTAPRESGCADCGKHKQVGQQQGNQVGFRGPQAGQQRDGKGFKAGWQKH